MLVFKTSRLAIFIFSLTLMFNSSFELCAQSRTESLRRVKSKTELTPEFLGGLYIKVAAAKTKEEVEKIAQEYLLRLAQLNFAMDIPPLTWEAQKLQDVTFKLIDKIAEKLKLENLKESGLLTGQRGSSGILLPYRAEFGLNPIINQIINRFTRINKQFIRVEKIEALEKEQKFFLILRGHDILGKPVNFIDGVPDNFDMKDYRLIVDWDGHVWLEKFLK